jgi:Sec-independent protein translocase protein TatA
VLYWLCGLVFPRAASAREYLFGREKNGTIAADFGKSVREFVQTHNCHADEIPQSDRRHGRLLKATR